MKRIQYYTYGGPETMVLKDVPAPSIAPGHVLVAVKAAAINPVDWKIRRGELKIMTGRKFPRAMGSDFSGLVVAAGAGVTRVAVGDAVFGQADMKECGAFAEQIAVREDFVVRKPESIGFENAACLPIVSITAWLALVEKAKVAQGQKVFINGCMGGVGRAATQIAGSVGAIVEGTCSAAQIAAARAAGVSHAYDYRTFDPSQSKRRYDVVFDTAGSLPPGAGLAMLNKRGRMIDINPTPPRMLRALTSRRFSIVIEKPSAQGLDAVAELASKGVLSQPVAERAALNDAVALLSRLEIRKSSPGKGVILCS